METNEVPGGSKGVSPDPLKNFSLDSLKDIKTLEKFLPAPLRNTSFNLDKIAETFKTNPSFDYKQVVDIMKSLKTIDASKQSQIESVLTSKGDNITNNVIKDILKSLNTTNQAEESKIKEESSIEEDSDEDSDSEDSLDNKNLVDNVKENLDKLIQSNSLKRKTTKKRWWTPEEV
jgi:hypothetical protein